jgi:hypothetical protein
MPKSRTKAKKGKVSPKAIFKGCMHFVIREGEKMIKRITARVIRGL